MAKRVTKSAIEWAKMMELLRPRQIPSARALKHITDDYVMKINEQPAELPKINFAEYRKTTNRPDVVDEYEEIYNSLQVPYPTDPDNFRETQQQIFDKEMAFKDVICDFWKYCIEEGNSNKKALENIPAPEEMTQQMMNHYFPNSQLNPHRTWPGFAPVHNPSHQPDRIGVDVPGCYKNHRYDYRNVQTWNEFEAEWDARIDMENRLKEEKRQKVLKEQEELERIRLLKEAKEWEKAGKKKKSA